MYRFKCPHCNMETESPHPISECGSCFAIRPGIVGFDGFTYKPNYDRLKKEEPKVKCTRKDFQGAEHGEVEEILVCPKCFGEMMAVESQFMAVKSTLDASETIRRKLEEQNTTLTAEVQRLDNFIKKMMEEERHRFEPQ